MRKINSHFDISSAFPTGLSKRRYIERQALRGESRLAEKLIHRCITASLPHCLRAVQPSLTMASAETSLEETQETPREEPILSPSHVDRVAYLYGHPLLGSLSPILHQTIYDALGLNWTQLPLSVSDTSSPTFPPPYTRSPPVNKLLASTRANPKFVGSSVTMPRKVTIMPHLDRLTEEAEQCGACNTIFVRQEEGKQTFIGTNTDCVGIREALLQNRHARYMNNGVTNPYKGKPALIIGGGGTARAAIYTLRRWLDVSKIYIVNRDAAEIAAITDSDKHRQNADPNNNAEIIPITDVAQVHSPDFEAPEAIISGIPNYPPRTADEIRTRKIIDAILKTQQDPEKGVILEMCYHPLPWTDIAELASQSGWKVILGTEALIWQGLEQARLWTEQDVIAHPGLLDSVKDVVAEAINERMRGLKEKL